MQFDHNRSEQFFCKFPHYRLLNSRTIPDQYTTPCIEDALNALTGSQWFSVLDLHSGYYQIAMSDRDKEKTALICPLGFFQFEQMPQGITGAPATFQRLMEKAVEDMNLLQVLVYLDDLIVFGKTLVEHEERRLKVLDRLGEVGLKLCRQVSDLSAKGQVPQAHCVARSSRPRSRQD